MARRMFTERVTRSDAFLDMPTSTQALYFHLLSEADDDGFVSSPKMVMRIVGANSDEINMLALKKFIIPFQGGVCVIKHWRMHNQVRKDRYEETKYKKEKLSLFIRENGSYTTNPENAIPVPSGYFTMENIDKLLLATTWQPTVALGEGSVGEDNKGETSSPKSGPLEDNEETMSWNKQPDDEAEVFIDADSGEEIKPKGKVKRNYKPVYSLFEEILGKKPNNWLVNITQQKCAENLFTERGIPAIKNALYWYQDHKEEKFCPQISSPSDLDSKWTKLAEFKQKYGN